MIDEGLVEICLRSGARRGVRYGRRKHGPGGRAWTVADVCFFFQAEDGIRDLTVTGVQTCALPICGDADYAWRMPDDEWDAVSLNYTSGTTGDPKGVVYHHRGAYLLALGNVVTCGMSKHPVYLWTLPMFHCNVWCFPWSISVVAGTHICLRWVRAPAML